MTLFGFEENLPFPANLKTFPKYCFILTFVRPDFLINVVSSAADVYCIASAVSSTILKSLAAKEGFTFVVSTADPLSSLLHIYCHLCVFFTIIFP